MSVALPLNGFSSVQYWIIKVLWRILQEFIKTFAPGPFKFHGPASCWYWNKRRAEKVVRTIATAVQNLCHFPSSSCECETPPVWQINTRNRCIGFYLWYWCVIGHTHICVCISERIEAASRVWWVQYQHSGYSWVLNVNELAIPSVWPTYEVSEQLGCWICQLLNDYVSSSYLGTCT